MTKTDMRLVGGPPKRLPMSCYRIVKAEASDTRLMGVVGLYVHWALDEDSPQIGELEKDFREPVRDYFQTYCFELEDGGLDRVSELEGKNSVKLGKMRNSVFGGLGGKLKALSPREALWIIASWSGDDALCRAKMPAGVKEVMEIAEDLEKTQPFTEFEKDRLMKKLCVRISTDYGLINYYIMRSVCYDTEGARLLTSPMAMQEDLEPLRLRSKACLIKNKVQLFSEENGICCYMCESSLDAPDGPYIMISEVSVTERGVISSGVRTAFKISGTENYQSLVRPELLTYFDIVSCDPEAFSDRLSRQISGASCKLYDNGILYMDYYSDNNHVEHPVFNIGDDLRASYFIAASGQLVVASYSYSGIISAEAMIRTTELGDDLMVRERYNFAAPVLGHFIESGYDNFDDFLDEIL